MTARAGNSSRPKRPVGERIVERLKGFTEALEDDQPISKRFTCRDVEFKLRPTRYNPGLVKDTRKQLEASQAVFAQFLGVSVQTVRAWEQGVNRPSMMARRFMDEIRRDPDYWRQRLRDVITSKATA